MRAQKLIPLLLWIALWLCPLRSSYAHPSPSSVVMIDLTVDGADVELRLPIEELLRARPLPGWTAATTGFSAAHRALLTDYVLAHVQLTNQKNNLPWRVNVQDLRLDHVRDPIAPDVVMTLRARAPLRMDHMKLAYDVISHEVRSHYAYVYVRSDFGLGIALAEPRLVGTIHFTEQSITVRRSGGLWQGFRAVVALGMEHVATGVDHVLFVFLLLLAAPLTAHGHRWSTPRTMRASLWAVLRILTAFTLGHSLTLALGALRIVSVPSAPVECGIALSLIVAAIHALRPLFARQEVTVAAAFGLLHGLAFASTLLGRNLGLGQTLLTLLGFNLGIELEQFGLSCVVLPWLLLLAQTAVYRVVRMLCGFVGAVLAVGFLIERVFATVNPLERWVLFLSSSAKVGLLVLALGSLLAVLLSRRMESTDAAPRSTPFAGKT